MPLDSPYVIGHSQKKPYPLTRFLPPIPEGIASSWLNNYFQKNNSDMHPWILDPFGAAPRLIREIAKSGYRVLVAANNPVARFIIEMTANPPKERQLRSALSELAASYRGDERIEPHLSLCMILNVPIALKISRLRPFYGNAASKALMPNYIPAHFVVILVHIQPIPMI